MKVPPNAEVHHDGFARPKKIDVVFEEAVTVPKTVVAVAPKTAVAVAPRVVVAVAPKMVVADAAAPVAVPMVVVRFETSG